MRGGLDNWQRRRIVLRRMRKGEKDILAGQENSIKKNERESEIREA